VVVAAVTQKLKDLRLTLFVFCCRHNMAPLYLERDLRCTDKAEAQALQRLLWTFWFSPTPTSWQQLIIRERDFAPLLTVHSV